MPFEPKILNPDDQLELGQPGNVGLAADPVWDDTEALGLSDDLAALAEQLHVDASYLHECHPAGSAAMTPRPQPVRSSVGRKLVWGTAALSVAGLLAGAIVWGWPWGQQTSTQALRVESNIDENSGVTLLADNEFASVHSPVVEVEALLILASGEEDVPALRTPEVEPVERALPADEIPAAFLRNVSSPELDGVLDLLATDDSGISI